MSTIMVLFRMWKQLFDGKVWRLSAQDLLGGHETQSLKGPFLAA